MLVKKTRFVQYYLHNQKLEWQIFNLQLAQLCNVYNYKSLKEIKYGLGLFMLFSSK